METPSTDPSPVSASPVASSPSPVPRSSSPADQARLRKERREAKIKAGGSARLGKITSMSGRPAASAWVESLSSTTPPVQPHPESTTTAPIDASLLPPTNDTTAAVAAAAVPRRTSDPAEVDISQHYYKPQHQRQQDPRAAPFPQPLDPLRAMALNNGNDDFGNATFPSPYGQQQQQSVGGGAEQDPMVQMLAQLLGTGDGTGTPPPFSSGPFGGASCGGAGAGAEGPGYPPGLVEMLGQAGATSPSPPSSRSSLAWRAVHAVFALTLAIYVLNGSPSFTGSKAGRTALFSSSSQQQQQQAKLHPKGGYNGFSDGPYDVNDAGRKLFWVFATAQLGLQGARFFLEGGGSSSSSTTGGAFTFLAKITPMLPYPWGDRLRVLLRYVAIWQVLVADAMVIIFVLGLGVWLRGGGG
ncbi:MAG: hypothetical protein M1825_000710 [Sarcosagium campestre]|nr:MAG: hypothetical protein M1825_000710 [Sarcosagium campestre]